MFQPGRSGLIGFLLFSDLLHMFDLKVPELVSWPALEFPEMLVDYFSDGQVCTLVCVSSDNNIVKIPN